MFKMKVSISIPDFSRKWITVDCPKCKLSNSIQLRDVIQRRIIVCKGCKRNVVLKDKYDSTKMSLRKITSSIKNIIR